MKNKKKSLRKKGKVIITRPSKSSPTIFTRRVAKSRKKLKLGEDEAKRIIFNRSPPTLLEILKKMEEGLGMENFKFFKYETRKEDEKIQVEDVVMAKLGKLKYSLDELTQEIPNEIM